MTHEQQIINLTEKLNELENESRRILTALEWATKVRLILFTGLLLFALISAFLFLRLYNDIKTNRFAEVQRLITEKPAEFSEPLTRQLMILAEEQGPYVIDVFRDQAKKDSKLYMAAFDTEREAMVANLQRVIEDKLARSYVTLLDEQEKLLAKEFPVLQDPVKREVVRKNMEKIYEKIGKRYYVNFFQEELDEMAEHLETFPQSKPKRSDVSIEEEIATEFLELVRLMLIHSEKSGIRERVEPTKGIVPAPKVLPNPDVDSVRDKKDSDTDEAAEKESTDADKDSSDKDDN